MRHRRPLLGLAYLVVVALLVATSIGTYRKAMPWQHSDDVVLHTRQVGLGLRAQSDVKYQGMLVGSVRSITTTGTEATVTLALDPGLIDQVPADVDAVIVPKTLFGEKFVDLRQPAARSTDAATATATGTATPTRPLQAGDQIIQTRTAVELGEIFDRLTAVLDTLQPQRVSAVLTTLANALRGRGDQIAATLRDTRSVLATLGPHYDTLVRDLQLLGTTTNTYADATPDLLSILDDSATISRENLTPHESDLAALLASATGTAQQTKAVLSRNSANLVRLSGRSRPVLKVLREYSTEVPCVLAALEAGDKLANLAAGVRGPYIALSVDMIVDQPGYSYPKDLPSNPRSDANVKNLPEGIARFGPHCPVLPQRVTALGKTPKPYSQTPYAQTFDVGNGGSSPSSSTSDSQPDPGVLISAREALARAIAAHELGMKANQVPGYAALLVLPLTQGQVSVR